jgi:hypothetical protein
MTKIKRGWATNQADQPANDIGSNTTDLSKAGVLQNVYRRTSR